MTVTVLVPQDEGVRALEQVPGVTAVRYTPGDALPPEAGRAEVLVPGFLRDGDFAAALAGLPALRYVQLLSAGAELWIGRVPEHVLLSTCRGAHGGSTAEWVLGALLSIYRELPAFDRARQRSSWQHHPTETLQDKKVLVVGAGDLGEQVRRRLVPFEVTVTMAGRRARDGVHGVEELPALLPEHDATVLVTPLTGQTAGMVDAAFLAAMPDGAILVNAARGPVVDTGALLAELRSGRLRAALDVTDPEPLPPGHPLWTVDGVFITPHVAGSVLDVAERSWRVAAEEIARYARGEQPRNLVHGEY